MPKLYNKYHNDFPKDAIYIGRGSKYGNPFTIEKYKDRNIVCELYEKLIENNETIKNEFIGVKEIKKKKELVDSIKKGFWILLKGYREYKEYYVVDIKKEFDVVKIGRKEWRYSSSEWTSLNSLTGNLLCVWQSKRKWWWKYFPFNDIICPFKDHG